MKFFWNKPPTFEGQARSNGLLVVHTARVNFAIGFVHRSEAMKGYVYIGPVQEQYHIRIGGFIFGWATTASIAYRKLTEDSFMEPVRCVYCGETDPDAYCADSGNSYHKKCFPRQ